MYYSLHYSWILLHPIYNKVTSICSLGEEYVKSGKLHPFLPQEKRYGKKSAWARLAHPADIVRVSTEFLVVTNTHTHLTGAMVRAACYGAPNLIAVAFG